MGLCPGGWLADARHDLERQVRGMPVTTDGDRITATAHETLSWQVRLVDDLLGATPATLPDLFALADPIYAAASQPGQRAVIIDRLVQKTYGNALAALWSNYGIQPIWLPVRGGERSKSLTTYNRLATQLVKLRLDRRSQPLFLVGGGSVGDVGAFVAATLGRYTPAVRIPTTLLAMADAGIAAKNGVNHAGKKNAFGTYDPASLVLACLAFCASESKRRISNGLAEIAKAALMESSALWSLLADHGAALRKTRMQHPVARDVLLRAIQIMLAELSDNRREPRLTRSMDGGHWITPTCELLDLSVWHGEWVAIDLALCVVLALRRTLLDADVAQHILDVLGRTLRLPLWHPLLADDDVLAHACDATTRHRGGRLRLPLLVGVGEKSFYDDVTVSEARGASAALRHMAARLGARAALRPGPLWAGAYWGVA
jgi:2-epi-5-epi-valiolone synthase